MLNMKTKRDEYSIVLVNDNLILIYLSEAMVLTYIMVGWIAG